MLELTDVWAGSFWTMPDSRPLYSASALIESLLFLVFKIDFTDPSYEILVLTPLVLGFLTPIEIKFEKSLGPDFDPVPPFVMLPVILFKWT